MRLHVIPSPFYAANGLVLVPSGAGTALVVDPSAGIQHLIREVLEREGVSVGAVLLTHGHPDHVWDAAAVSSWGPDGSSVPVYLPGPDMYEKRLPTPSKRYLTCGCVWSRLPVTPKVLQSSWARARWIFA